MSRAEALLTARRRVPAGDDTVAAPTTSLVAEPTARGGLELAWLVRLAVRKPRGDWNVVVSARSGEVLEAYDSITRVDGTALTYSPNPVQMTDNSALTRRRRRRLGGADGRAPDVHADRPQRRHQHCSAARSPTSTPGRRRRLQSALQPQGQASNAARTYNYTRSQDAFEEAAAYLAVTRVQRTYAALGFTRHLPRPRADRSSHCISVDNSFFSDDRRCAAHGRRRRRRRRGLRRHRARVRPRDPGRPGARLGPRQRHRAAARWARASATSSRPTSTSRTATPTYQAGAPLLRRGVGRGLLQRRSAARTTAAAACAGSTAPTRTTGPTSAPTAARRSRSTTTAASGRRC